MNDSAEFTSSLEITPVRAPHRAGWNGSDEFASRRWLEFTGSAEKAILGFDRPLTVHPDDLEDHLNKWRASLVTGVPFENEARHCNADGTYRWFLVRAVPLRDRHGAILKWFGTLQTSKKAKGRKKGFENFAQTSPKRRGRQWAQRSPRQLRTRLINP